MHHTQTALVSANFVTPPIAFSEEAEDERAECISLAAEVGEVTDPDTQARAVNAQKVIRAFLSKVEKARKEKKEPILEAGRELDRRVGEFVEVPKEQELRIATAVGNYQQAELEKLRRAEQAAAAERERIAHEQAEAIAAAERAAAEERRKAEAKAAAERADARNEQERAEADARAAKAQQEAEERLAAERKRQEELAAQQTEAIAPVTAPAKAEGQSIRQEWEITRINEFALMRARPDLVRKVEFDLRSIKEELARGLKLPGVEAQLLLKSSVRLTREKVIEV